MTYKPKRLLKAKQYICAAFMPFQADSMFPSENCPKSDLCWQLLVAFHGLPCVRIPQAKADKRTKTHQEDEDLKAAFLDPSCSFPVTGCSGTGKLVLHPKLSKKRVAGEQLLQILINQVFNLID